MENYENIIVKNGNCSQIIIYVGWCKYHDEFRISTSLYPNLIIKKYLFCDWFSQLPIHPSTKCTRTETLHFDYILFFDGTCQKKLSQTNWHPYTKRHIQLRQKIPPYILLISTCDLPPLLTCHWLAEWQGGSTSLSMKKMHIDWHSTRDGSINQQSQRKKLIHTIGTLITCTSNYFHVMNRLVY